MGRRAEDAPFWSRVLLRVAGVFVAGLALVLFFREVMVPILRDDAERIQKNHAK